MKDNPDSQVEIEKYYAGPEMTSLAQNLTQTLELNGITLTTCVVMQRSNTKHSVFPDLKRKEMGCESNQDGPGRSQSKGGIQKLPT